MTSPRFIVSLIVTGFLVGCAARPPVAPPSPTELSTNPALLLGAFDSSTLTLDGVRLGDAASSVKQEPDYPSSDPAWIINSAGNRYRIESDRVAVLGLWDSRAIDRLSLSSPTDIERQFGVPDAVDSALFFFGGKLKVYRYSSKKLAVLWNEMEERVVGINVSR